MSLRPGRRGLRVDDTARRRLAKPGGGLGAALHPAPRARIRRAATKQECGALDWSAVVQALVLGYLLGSVPFGLVLTRLGGAGDVRTVGSGNIGATNVLRTGHKGLAAATLLLDAAKGTAAVLLVRQLWPGAEGPAAVGAVVGHCFPVWLRFKGGKGIATLLGVALGLAPLLGLVFALAWLAGLALARFSSLAGISAAVATPIAAWLLDEPGYAMVLAGLALLVVWQHRENLGRLRAGTEPKVGAPK
jgi:acyl phosphate:glycerol-3-phosphate acyltransferase